MSTVLRYPVLAPELLPEFRVLDAIDSEAILASRMIRFKELWSQRDPPLGISYDVENLEFDPIKINQEVNTFFEMTLRDRVNQAARAVTLAYASGGDLDVIGSRYPGGVPRLPLVPNPRPYDDAPLDWEDDERYRRRLWLSAHAFSTAGSEEAYVFWALTAAPLLRDVSVVVDRPNRIEHPHVIITLMRGGPDPKPTPEDLFRVHNQLYNLKVRPATDVIFIEGPKVVKTPYEVDVFLYPAAVDSRSTILAEIERKLSALAKTHYFLGVDHVHAAIIREAKILGVSNVKVKQPAADIYSNLRQVVKVEGIAPEWAKFEPEVVGVRANYAGTQE